MSNVQKRVVTFQFTGWLIGIPRMAYYNIIPIEVATIFPFSQVNKQGQLVTAYMFQIALSKGKYRSGIEFGHLQDSLLWREECGSRLVWLL